MIKERVHVCLQMRVARRNPQVQGGHSPSQKADQHSEYEMFCELPRLCCTPGNCAMDLAVTVNAAGRRYRPATKVGTTAFNPTKVRPVRHQFRRSCPCSQARCSVGEQLGRSDLAGRNMGTKIVVQSQQRSCSSAQTDLIQSRARRRGACRGNEHQDEPDGK